MQSWLQQGLQELYVFTHSADVPAMPVLARDWVQALNPLLPEPLHVPEVYARPEQQGLF